MFIKEITVMNFENYFPLWNDLNIAHTEDGMPSAQWEIMVLVTEDGHEVLSW